MTAGYLWGDSSATHLDLWRASGRHIPLQRIDSRAWARYAKRVRCAAGARETLGDSRTFWDDIKSARQRDVDDVTSRIVNRTAGDRGTRGIFFAALNTADALRQTDRITKVQRLATLTSWTTRFGVVTSECGYQGIERGGMTGEFTKKITIKNAGITHILNERTNSERVTH